MTMQEQLSWTAWSEECRNAPVYIPLHLRPGVVLYSSASDPCGLPGCGRTITHFHPARTLLTVEAR